MELTMCRKLRSKITSLEARIADVQSTAITARRIDFVPRAAATESTPEKLTRLIVDGERELEALREEFAIAAGELAAEIFQRVADVKTARILLLRYVDCLSFEDIIRATNFSRGHVFKLHRDGCRKFLGTSANC